MVNAENCFFYYPSHKAQLEFVEARVNVFHSSLIEVSFEPCNSSHNLSLASEGKGPGEEVTRLTYWSIWYVESSAACGVVGMKSYPDRVKWCYDPMRPDVTTVNEWIAKLFCCGQHNVILGTSWWFFDIKLASKTDFDPESSRYL